MVTRTPPNTSRCRSLERPWQVSNGQSITILTIPDHIRSAVATKRFRWHGDRWDKVSSYETGCTHFGASVRPVHSIYDLHNVVSELSARPRSFVVRGDVHPDASTSLIWRKYRDIEGRADVLVAPPLGPRWMMIDLDDAEAPPWIDPNYKETLEAAIRWAIKTYLPEWLEDVTVVYQWSASAGFQGWDRLRLHLWFYLDRPGHDAELRRWAKNTPHVDEAVYNPVQPHYVADPIAEGDVDPLKGRRCGVLKGKRDIVVLPDDIWPAEFRRKVDEGFAEARHSRPRHAHADAEPSSEQIRQSRDHLRKIVERIEGARPGTRHNTVRDGIWEAYRACVGLSRDEIDAAIWDAALPVLTEAYRSSGEARADIQRAVDGARRKVKRPDWGPSFAIPSLPDGGPPVELDQARRDFGAAVKQAIRQGGIYAYSGPPGIGKTYTTQAEFIEALTNSEIDSAETVLPTHDLIDEKRQAGRAMADKYNDAGDLTIHSVVTRTASNCQRFDEIQAAARLHPQGPNRICRACELYKDTECPFWDANGAERGDCSTYTLKTHALESSAKGEAVDALHIDESPQKNVIADAYHDRRSLGLAVAEGSVIFGDSDSKKALERLQKRSQTDYESYPAEVLRRVCPASQVKVTADYSAGQKTLSDALEAGHGERMAHLRVGYDWRADAGLQQALEQDWGECYVKRGKLHLTYVRPLDLNRAKTALLTDATMTPAIARAMLGSEVVYRHFDFKQVGDVDVIWVPYNAGSRSHIVGPDGKPKRDKAALVFAAAALKWGAGPKCLNVTHKRWLQRGWISDFALTLDSTWIWFGGTEARGANAYQHCDTVRVDSWRVPLGKIRQWAYALCQLAGDDWADADTQLGWIDEAQYQAEGAEILQTLNRVRYLTSEGNTTLVIVDDRDPAGLGLNVTNKVDPAELVLDVLGQVIDGAAPALLKRTVETHDGVYLPTVDARLEKPMTVADVVKRVNVEWQEDEINADLRSCFSPTTFRPLGAALTDYARGDWERLADEAGLVLDFIHTDAGGHPTPFFFREPLDLDVLEDWVDRKMKANKWRLDGEDDWRVLESTFFHLYTALDDVNLLDGDRGPLGYGDIVDCLAETADKHPRTIKIWLGKARDAYGWQTTTEAARRVWCKRKSEDYDCLFGHEGDAPEAKVVVGTLRMRLPVELLAATRGGVATPPIVEALLRDLSKASPRPPRAQAISVPLVRAATKVYSPGNRQDDRAKKSNATE